MVNILTFVTEKESNSNEELFSLKICHNYDQFHLMANEVSNRSGHDKFDKPFYYRSSNKDLNVFLIHFAFASFSLYQQYDY